MVQIHTICRHPQFTAEIKDTPTNLKDQILKDIQNESQLLAEIKEALFDSDTPQGTWGKYSAQCDAIAEDLHDLSQNTDVPSNIRSLLEAAGNDSYNITGSETNLSNVEKAQDALDKLFQALQS